MSNMSFADRLKQSMKDKNLKQVELLRAAEEKGLKIGKSHISQYVSGKTIPRDNIMKVLAEILEVDSAWLKGNESSDSVLKTEVEPQTAASAAPAAEQQAAAPATDNEIYQLLYAQPVDQDGVRQGPFQFTLTTGGTIDIEGVRDLQPDFMVCTVYGTGKSVRMKYTQVESIARYATE